LREPLDGMSIVAAKPASRVFASGKYAEGIAMTLIDLLIMMFWTLCCMLLDLPIRHYLGVAVPRGGPPLEPITGIVIGSVLPLYLDSKHAPKQLLAVLMGAPLWMALLSVCLLRHWVVTFHMAEFALGFYVPTLWWSTEILLWIVFDLFPTCKSGKCRGRRDFFGDTALPQREQEGDSSRWIAYKCQCGDGYLRCGKKFMVLDSERTPHPYKKLIGFHKWADDLDQ
jgi:hypothetical protein